MRNGLWPLEIGDTQFFGHHISPDMTGFTVIILIDSITVFKTVS